MKKACLRIACLIFVLAATQTVEAFPNCIQWCSMVPCPDAEAAYCDGMSCRDLGVCFPIQHG